MDTRMPKHTLKSILFLLILLLSKPLFAIDSIAETALVMDISTGETLLDKNSDKRTFPSSMTKIMTVLVAFEKIKNGTCLLYTSPSPRDATLSRMPSSA